MRKKQESTRRICTGICARHSNAAPRRRRPLDSDAVTNDRNCRTCSATLQICQIRRNLCSLVWALTFGIILLIAIEADANPVRNHNHSDVATSRSGIVSTEWIELRQLPTDTVKRLKNMHNNHHGGGTRRSRSATNQLELLLRSAGESNAVQQNNEQRNTKTLSFSCGKRSRSETSRQTEQYVRIRDQSCENIKVTITTEVGQFADEMITKLSVGQLLERHLCKTLDKKLAVIRIPLSEAKRSFPRIYKKCTAAS